MLGRWVRRAFTLVELLVVITIIGILIALLLPAVQAAREAARRAQCVNNLKQAGLALHNYHAATESFPWRMGGTQTGNNNGSRMSGWPSLLPYLEQAPLYQQVTAVGMWGGNNANLWPGWGWAPWDNKGGWCPWSQQVPALLCPSDDGPRSKNPNDLANNSYNFCVGDSPQSAEAWEQNPRGIFGAWRCARIADIRDGTSNTIAMGERVYCADRARIKGGTAAVNIDNGVAPATCLSVAGPNGMIVGNTQWEWSGRRWADGLTCYTGFNTILPPNAPACSAGEGNPGCYNASSYHPGGANVLLSDGAVRFVSETIDTGNLGATFNSLPPGSTYGVWGALGSKNNGDQVGSFESLSRTEPDSGNPHSQNEKLSGAWLRPDRVGHAPLLFLAEPATWLLPRFAHAISPRCARSPLPTAMLTRKHPTQ